ncbi:hypothetical protein [Alkalihalobacillus sp. TS-13]|uniref:hypothetical protein n=1 Tax=Alkalihalobacillus sp. TS-13 TaxID=2842455 RepID=UPI001C87DD70|nr:hypothetical protein [Alkalihalobacillus sp. TS-13]
MDHYRQMQSQQPKSVQEAQQQFLKHAALAEHYERHKIAYAGNSTAYYKYAELQYFHKSRALYFKSFFSATSLL